MNSLQRMAIKKANLLKLHHRLIKGKKPKLLQNTIKKINELGKPSNDKSQD